MIKTRLLQGESLKNVIFPVHRSYQVTSLAWHPEKTVLITGWENGELRLWDGTEKEFFNITGLHKCPVILLEYSEKGGRLVSCDSVRKYIFLFFVYFIISSFFFIFNILAVL